MNIKTLHHICIQTEKYKESLEFYTKVLRFQLIQETPNFHKRDFNTWLKLGSLMIELQTSKKGQELKERDRLSEGIAHMCFLVDNIHHEYDALKKLGCINFKTKHGKELYKVESSYLFKIKAPEGTEIEFRDKDKI